MINDRFIHEGRELGEWLLQLVGDSSLKRREAYRVIVGRFYMPSELLLQPDAESETITASFHAAVREVVRSPGFPTADYVRELFTLSMALEDQRLTAWKKAQRESEKQQDDEWNKAQRAKLGTNPTQAQVRRYLKRASIRICRALESVGEGPSDEAFETGLAIGYVLDALGEELLPAASLIRHMLKETRQSWIASAAIARMGRTALEFYPDLIAGLERDDPNSDFRKPLGLLLRDAREKIEEVLHLTSSTNARVRINSITALGYCGRDTLVRFPEAEARLLAHIPSCESDEWYACANSLGKIAVTPDAVSVLLAATYSTDADQVAAAIYNLGQIGRESERVVPRLIELLDNFEEPSPDWSYHGRIVGALKVFGSFARPAIPALIRCIWTPNEAYYDANFKLAECRNPDATVIGLLGDFGPAAADALPVLLEVKAEMERRAMEEQTSAPLIELRLRGVMGGRSAEDRVSTEESKSEAINLEDCCPEYLKQTIRQISGNH